MFDNIRLSLSSLWANKVRALLTMLGIIIGIGSVIAIVTVGDSLTGSISTSMQEMGANNITVRVSSKDSSSRNFMNARMSDEDLITQDMVDEFKKAYTDDIYAISVSSNIQTTGTVYDGANYANMSVMGVNGDYETYQQITMQYGRFIKDTDDERQIAVVSDEFCNALYGYSNSDLIGKDFLVTLSSGGALKVYIAGIYQYESTTTVDDSTDITSNIYMPINLANKINSASGAYETFTVMTSTTTDTASFMTQTENFFNYYYQSNESYEVSATSMETMLESLTSMLSTVQLAISAIAAISLLVGGIGVMNIMMVSITERTKEIGTRKALGATNGNIRVQFVTEAVVICLIGGIIGVMVGVGLGALGANMLGYAAKPSMLAVAGAVSFSMVIGVFFGYYPAQKAAKLNPIDALRYE